MQSRFIKAVKCITIASALAAEAIFLSQNITTTSSVQGYEIAQKGITDDYALSVWQTSGIEQVPAGLLKAFDDEGLKITYGNLFSYATAGGFTTGGITTYDKQGRCTGIQIRSDLVVTGKDHVLCHEFGHYMNYLEGDPASSDEWAALTEKYFPVSARHDAEYFGSPEEFFAEEFAYYCDYKAALAHGLERSEGLTEHDNCAEVFEFIDRYAAKYYMEDLQ